MSTLVADIVSHIEGQIAIVLPVSFSKASFIYDPSSDKRKGASNKYAVKPLTALESDLNIGSYAVNHDFEITLTNTYKSSRLLNDYDMADKVIVLQDYGHDIFKQVQSSIGSAQIRQVFNLVIDEAVLDEENHIITQKITLTIKYQNSLK